MLVHATWPRGIITLCARRHRCFRSLLLDDTMVGVVVVGSANVDLVTNAPRMAEPGETLMGTRFEQLFGGKGANQAVAAGLLGSSVAMVAKLGADSLGEGAHPPLATPESAHAASSPCAPAT